MSESVNKYLEDIREKAVTVILDKERHIIFDLNALADLEEEYGDITEAFKKLQSGSIKAIKKFIFIGFKHEDEELTEREAGKMVTLENMGSLGTAVNEAMGRGFPNEEGPAKQATSKKK